MNQKADGWDDAEESVVLQRGRNTCGRIGGGEAEKGVAITKWGQPGREGGDKMGKGVKGQQSAQGGRGGVARWLLDGRDN